eukprot:m51a1_g11822 hypothetical protein (272) ;mRNA; f:411986-413156
MLRVPRVVLSELRLAYRRPFTMVVEIPRGWRMDHRVSTADVLAAAYQARCWAERDGFPTHEIKRCPTCLAEPVAIRTQDPEQFAPSQSLDCERFVFENCVAQCRAHLAWDTLVLTVELDKLQFVSHAFRLVPCSRRLHDEGAGRDLPSPPQHHLKSLARLPAPRALPTRSPQMVVRVWKICCEDKVKLFNLGNDFFIRFMSRMSSFVDYRVNFTTPEVMVTYSHCNDPSDLPRSTILALRYMRNEPGFNNVFGEDVISAGIMTQLLVSDTQ